MCWLSCPISRLRAGSAGVVGRGSSSAGASSSVSLPSSPDDAVFNNGAKHAGKRSLLACAAGLCLSVSEGGREGRWDGGDRERTPLHTHTHTVLFFFSSFVRTFIGMM